MTGLKRRIERLEKETGADKGQMLYLGPNLESDEEEETPWSIKISPGLWATAFGAPFSGEQIEQLRAEFTSGKGNP